MGCYLPFGRLRRPNSAVSLVSDKHQSMGYFPPLRGAFGVQNAFAFCRTVVLSRRTRRTNKKATLWVAFLFVWWAVMDSNHRPIG